MPVATAKPRDLDEIAPRQRFFGIESGAVGVEVVWERTQIRV